MVSEAIELATALAHLLTKLLDGSASDDEKRRVRDILAGDSASAQAERDILAARRLEKLADFDDPGEAP